MSGKRIVEEMPCPDCDRFHTESLLRPGGDPESSIAYCYTGGSFRVFTEGEFLLIEKESGEWPEWLRKEASYVIGYLTDDHDTLAMASRTNTRQFCARCRSVDRVGFLAPKNLWRLVAGPHWEHDILCLRCFAEIGDEKGIEWDVPDLEFYPVSYVTLQANRDHTEGET